MAVQSDRRRTCRTVVPVGRSRQVGPTVVEERISYLQPISSPWDVDLALKKRLKPRNEPPFSGKSRGLLKNTFTKKNHQGLSAP